MNQVLTHLPTSLLLAETTNVELSDTDRYNSWKLSAFYIAMEQVSAHHVAIQNYSNESLILQNRTWVLSRNRIKFLRWSTAGETVSILTWAKGLRQKILYVRDYEFRDASDNVIALASSAWLVVDLVSRRFLPPAISQVEMPLLDRESISEELGRIAHPANLREVYQIRATYSNIDFLNHVNNARYLDWVMDAFPMDFHARYAPDWLQINYSNEVRPEEVISIQVAEPMDNQPNWIIIGEKTGLREKAFEVEMNWRKR
ncbi:MAG TPA: thioesterase [Bellilinea sp.]|nr:thioesterase [Bellilinea sp.]